VDARAKPEHDEKISEAFEMKYISSLAVSTAAALLLFAAAPPASAADAVTFKGKSVTLLVGSGTGGSTDLSARLFTPFFTKYLPGNPNVIVQNMPGAHNMTAMNYFAQVARPDGLTVIVGSGSEVDPINYRVAQSHYDPTTFEMVGGVNLGGTGMVIRNDAKARLMDKSAKPVVLGSIAGYPHLGTQMSAWGIKYLGWNARWVTGYGNDSDLGLALERGEIETSTFADADFSQQLVRLLDKSKYTLIYQTGIDAGKLPSAQPALKGVPIFDTFMTGKIKDPLALEAYEYWRDLSYVFKWLALPPKTPKPILAAYRAAYDKVVADPEFVAASQKVTPGFAVFPVEDLIENVREVASVHNEALTFMTDMLREQGLKVEDVKEKEDAPDKSKSGKGKSKGE
jgi:hypothetical protein